MDSINDIIDTAGMLASAAWCILTVISGGHPSSALAVAVVGGGWFAGVWMIAGSFS